MFKENVIYNFCLWWGRPKMWSFGPTGPVENNPLLSSWPCKYYFIDVTLKNHSPQNSAYVFGLAIWSTQKAVRDMKDKHPQRKSLNLVFISTIVNTGTYSYLKWNSVLNMLKLISQYWESRDRTGSVFHSFLPFWNRQHDAWRAQLVVSMQIATSDATLMLW